MARFFLPVEDNHYAVLDEMLAEETYIMDAFYGPPLESMVESKALVDQIFMDMAIKIIMGEDTVEEFDSALHSGGSACWVAQLARGVKVIN